MVSESGTLPDERKVEAVRQFLTPINLKMLRSFLGLASYYRRFIAGFSSVAGPLFALTRKGVLFQWASGCEQAFSRLKELMTHAPLLSFSDFSKPFLLETDASGEGLGAVLAQKQGDGAVHPIAYASRTLQKHEKNYGITELEALGVVWATRHFRHYLYGHHCDVFTDHEELKALLNTPHPSGKLARWGLSLQELDLEIHYRLGKANANADALSRFPMGQTMEFPGSGESGGGYSSPQAVVAVLSGTQPLTEGGDDTMSDSHLGLRQRRDPELGQIMAYLDTGEIPAEDGKARELVLSRSQYEIIDGVLYYIGKDHGRRVVPAKRNREELFTEAHRGVLGGHLEEAKIYGQLMRHYWWPRMRSDVAKWCQACQVCASRQVGRAVVPPLSPIPVAGPFDRVGVDVISYPRSTMGNRYAVVFVDYLTKWPEVFATSDQSALTIARLLVEQIICRHGVPVELLSDRGPAFLSRLLMEVNNVMGIHKVNTTAYHPQTDGLVERFNRTLTDMLAKTVEANGTDWDQRLPYVLFAYRASLQQSTQESPFFLLYGRDPRLPTRQALSPDPLRQVVALDDYKAQMLTGLSEAWELAQKEVVKAQQRQKRQYDRHSRGVHFQKGDRVFVYMPGMVRGKAYKFARPFQGPYRIVDVYGTGAEVQLVTKPKSAVLRVALDRLRKVPEGMLELSQEGDAEETAEQHASCPAVETVELSQPQATEPKNDNRLSIST